ncbi:MAG: peptidoglycan DD-metalloendopeptidase family protein [Cellvibrionaceae bacterium]
MGFMTTEGQKLTLWVFKILSILLVLSACSSSTNRAPVQDRTSVSSSKLGYHLVAKGETLYSIAWRYGIDYKKLAKANGVNSSFTIYPGQKIYLNKTVAKVSSSKVASKSSSKKAKPQRSKSTTSSQKKVAVTSTPTGSLKWRWPVQGRIIARFSSLKSLNKGIDIKGSLGEPVVAAAPGAVVYAGSGIRGYGNLLIIKHNDRFLSAYAHNSRLLIKEGEVIKAGQKIAEIGNSGTDQSKLHFEIRRDGKPIDPLRYLPKR